tara:strand:+ start:808 stop:3165 length:2358 start_codon:yes stop_codon:yes gene_type:complete
LIGDSMRKNIGIVFLAITFAAYNVGDSVSDNHLNQEFNLCYSAPGNMDNVIKLGDYNGNTNGGDYNVLVIDMSATWCGPCQSLIPLFDDLQQNYSNNNYVEFFVALSDLNQPYSCTQWGNLGSSGIPNIIDDTGYPIFNMFNTGSSFPSLVMIDHEMKVHYKEAGYYSTFVEDASLIIDEMLLNMENSLILYNLVDFSLDDNLGDGDELLNPNESFNLEFTIANNSFYLDALNVTGAISSPLTGIYNDITFDLDELYFGDIAVDGSSVISLSGFVNSDVYIGNHEFELIINAEYVDLNGNYGESIKTYPFNVEVTLNQSGFPFDTNSEVKSSPAVVDFTGDGNNEIIFGDNSGLIHVLDNEGNAILNNIFPYDTGNQIWGSPAAGYINQDDNLDIVITSKSKHLYILDIDGLKLDYNANQYLIGTPALGNLDDDEDLEIVFTTYSNDAKVFAINIDGTDVDGFPIILDEKMQKGVALADFNNNGKDDIVVGTDSDNIYLINDDGSIEFSFLTEDKIRSAPIIIDVNNQKIIVVGSKDGSLYAINESGDLHFQFETDGAIYTSPTVLEYSNNLMIFFGNDEGELFALDIYGNPYEGFPIDFLEQDILLPFNSVSGSIVFEDLDANNIPEIIFGDESGKLNILKATNSDFIDFSYYNNFPISNTFAYASSVNIYDIDNDNDLEVFGGTTGDVVIIDIKENTSLNNYWNIYRANYHRNGYYLSDSVCTAGDINNDGTLDILDIVSMINIIIDSPELTDVEFCASDMNSDGIIDILDIVTLINSIMEQI